MSSQLHWLSDWVIPTLPALFSLRVQDNLEISLPYFLSRLTLVFCDQNFLKIHQKNANEKMPKLLCFRFGGDLTKATVLSPMRDCRIMHVHSRREKVGIQKPFMLWSDLRLLASNTMFSKYTTFTILPHLPRLPWDLLIIHKSYCLISSQ